MVRTKNTETMNMREANKWLIRRFTKIIESDVMDEITANEIIKMTEDWKGSYKERALQKLDDEIARLQEMRKLALEDMSREGDIDSLHLPMQDTL